MNGLSRLAKEVKRGFKFDGMAKTAKTKKRYKHYKRLSVAADQQGLHIEQALMRLPENRKRREDDLLTIAVNMSSPVIELWKKVVLS